MLALACERTQTPPPEITVSPTPSASVAATAATATATATATVSAAVDPEPEPFGALWLGCRKDADCTVVSLGCCHARAVSIKYQAEGQKVLDDSKLERCAVKAACAQAPAVCQRALCKLKTP